MPNPANYPNSDAGYKRYMQDCMHTTVHKEHKRKEHGIAQCLNMWRQKYGPRHPGKAKMAEIEFPHENYLKDHGNCPVCGERYIVTCRCRLGNKACANKHGWHTCDVHNKVFVGDSHSLGVMRDWSKCICPLSEEERALTGQKMAKRIARTVLAELSGSEAIYGFCGWLTTRDDPTVMSAHDDAGCIADLIDEFCKTNKLTEPREHWDDELTHPKTADFPDHPDDSVVSKSEHALGGPEVSELDVFSYYTDGVVSKMLQELKGRDLFIAIKPRGKTPSGKPIYVRHPYDKKSEYIRINSEKDFETYHSGRTVEYHVTMPASCPYYIIDFDAVEDWATTKKITAECSTMLGKLPEVKKVEIRYSGKRGFHILGWLKKSIPIDQARERLKEHLKEAFGDRDDLVLGESPSGKKGSLGVSPMKLNGGQVALWSMRVTGLCCVEVPQTKLASFKKEDARPEKVYKKLTGKTLVPSKKKEASQRVVSAFLKIAGYDREKIKPGYKGKFVIHNHLADKAGQHWDLRLEFPVTSVHKALKDYEGKRLPGRREPEGPYPDKPGSVFRSFAVRKHRLPAGDTKMFIVETEDHPIAYGTFRGKIPEGYGAGDVEIFDHGTYEILDVEGDKKYTLEFHGKKVHGAYALVKYQRGFLWVKVKEKRASAIDSVCPTEEKIRKSILNVLSKYVLSRVKTASADIQDVYEDTINQFESGKKKQPWELVKRSQALPVWKKFGGTGEITKEDIFEIYELTKENLVKVIVNSMLWDSDHVNEENADEFHEFIVDEKNFGRRTDQDRKFNNALTVMEKAHTPADQLLAVDRVFDLVHGSGPVANWFIEGGNVTLNELQDWVPKSLVEQYHHK